MAQDAVGGVAAPEGGLFRAWLDVLVHPKFATFQRWFPQMSFRWRAISLVVSLLLAFAAGLVVIGHDAMFAAHYSLQALSGATFRDYLFSPHGLSQWFRLWCGAALFIVLIPATAAAIGYRRIGPYHLRFGVGFGTWLQALPLISLLALISISATFILGFFASSSFVFTIATYAFEYVPVYICWGAAARALAAGSGQWAIHMDDVRGDDRFLCPHMRAARNHTARNPCLARPSNTMSDAVP